MTTEIEYLPLHLKYRPATLGDFVGNSATVEALKTTLDRPARPHSYLLTGPKGCGKTTLARIIASRLGCSKRDFHEMNSANYRGIDSMRDLISNSVRRPWDGDVTVYLLDECHQQTKDSQSAVLKLLEEPPSHVYFVLATTNPEKLLDTIKSRCAHFTVQALRRDVVLDRLIWVCEQEGCSDKYPTEEVLIEIARSCAGSMRQALIILDQIIDIADEHIALEAIVEATGDDKQTIDLCRALKKGQKWSYIQGLLKGIDAEPEAVRYAVLGYMNTVLLSSDDPAALVVIRRFSQSVMYSGQAGLTLACYDVTKEIRGRTRGE